MSQSGFQLRRAPFGALFFLWAFLGGQGYVRKSLYLEGFRPKNAQSDRFCEQFQYSLSQSQMQCILLRE